MPKPACESRAAQSFSARSDASVMVVGDDGAVEIADPQARFADLDTILIGAHRLERFESVATG
jgi:hypothetical protein